MRQCDIINIISFVTNWWMDLAYSRSVLCLSGATVKMLVSPEPATPLSPNIFMCIPRITTMTLVTFEPTILLSASIISCISGITDKTLVFFEAATLLSVGLQISVYCKHRQHEANIVLQHDSHSTWLIHHSIFPLPIVLLIYLLRYQTISSYRQYHTRSVSWYHIIQVESNKQNDMKIMQIYWRRSS